MTKRIKDARHKHYDTVAAALQWLVEHHQQQPSLEQLAEQLHISQFHLQRTFKDWAGISPKQFLQFITWQSARKELRLASNVLESSLAVGFSSPARLHDLAIKLEAATPGEIRSGGAGLRIEYGVHPSPFGLAFIAQSSRGICHLGFADDWSEQDIETVLSALWPNAGFVRKQSSTGENIARIFNDDSENKNSADILLHVNGSDFQLKVWQALLEIPPGSVRTYQQIAEFIGRQKANRAVGSAVGKNPVAYLIPCHRVIRANGEFGQYHWGAVRKQSLLLKELADYL